MSEKQGDELMVNKLLISAGNVTYNQLDSQTLSTDEKKLVNDFVYLLEKSKQLFTHLRNLPHHGQFNWQIHFSRTFDCFSKLWKFQQDHRTVLDTKYGLQRWQIGEIASRIGQLYYHYYLRTSDTNYLHEALIFYLAIRQRKYYSDFDDPIIFVKKLRYYARFLVVSLMINKLDLVSELREELSGLIEEYANSNTPQDVNEWKGILNEVSHFKSALCHISVIRTDTSQVLVAHRVTPEDMILPDLQLSAHPLKLHHAVIAGTQIGQAKITELSIDMYRIGMLLERTPKSLNDVVNPIKQFMYKPTPTELMCSLSVMGSDLPPESVQLVYLSGNNVVYNDRTAPQEAFTTHGGMHFAHKDVVNKKPTSRYHKDLLHAEDINPFLRSPTLLIVESEQSAYFNTVSPVFRQPVVVLISPKLVPHTLKGSDLGSLMTMFLHCPMQAICVACNVAHIREYQWKQGLRIINSTLSEILTNISSSKNIHPHYIQLLDDPFIRLIILRFCFCVTVLQLHTAFKTEEYYPTSVPSLSSADIFNKPNIKRSVIDIANILESVVLFSDP